MEESLWAAYPSLLRSPQEFTELASVSGIFAKGRCLNVDPEIPRLRNTNPESDATSHDCSAVVCEECDDVIPLLLGLSGTKSWQCKFAFVIGCLKTCFGNLGLEQDVLGSRMTETLLGVERARAYTLAASLFFLLVGSQPRLADYTLSASQDEQIAVRFLSILPSLCVDHLGLSALSPSAPDFSAFLGACRQGWFLAQLPHQDE